jgi:hypothetical protein
MTTIHSQCVDLLRFLSKTENEQISIIFDNTDAWYFKAGEQPVLKLFEQFFEYIDYLLASDDFGKVFQEDSVLRELYSLLELIYESGDRFNMGANKFFQREAVASSPIWQLIRRLARQTLVVMAVDGAEMTVSFEDVISL